MLIPKSVLSVGVFLFIFLLTMSHIFMFLCECPEGDVYDTLRRFWIYQVPLKIDAYCSSSRLHYCRSPSSSGGLVSNFDGLVLYQEYLLVMKYIIFTPGVNWEVFTKPLRLCVVSSCWGPCSTLSPSLSCFPPWAFGVLPWTCVIRSHPNTLREKIYADLGFPTR